MITGNNDENLSLGEAAGMYLSILPNEKKNAAQQESLLVVIPNRRELDHGGGRKEILH